MNWIDVVLFVALVALGSYVLACNPWGIFRDQAAAAGLAGALFGGAALLLGNWINRVNDRHKAAEEQADQAEKLKAMIAAELVDVACSLMSAKQVVDAAVSALKTGGSAPLPMDMSPYRPRQMPFTDSLGSKLLVLNKESIAAIATLRSNLAVTRQSMDEIPAGAGGLLKATSLSNGLGQDMTDLAAVFDHVAPTRKLLLPDATESTLATEILRGAARPPPDAWGPANPPP